MSFLSPDIIGSAGVALLALAFLANLVEVLSVTSIVYSILNIIGASLACLSSYLINFIPFVVLEGLWTAVAIWGLARTLSQHWKANR
jgi:hypothetical protein